MVLTAFMQYYAIRRKYVATITAILIAGMISVILCLSDSSFILSLTMFFITSSKATKYKKSLKTKFEENNGNAIQRDWKNVVCNGGVGTLFALIYFLENGSKEIPIDFNNYYKSSWLAISVLASVSCANGDTWASELGTVLSTGDPYLITTLRRVPKGTNGGVSIYGLIISALGGLAIGLAFYIPIIFCSHESSPAQLIPILITGIFGGLFGSIIDSLLGATLQFSGMDGNTGKIVDEMGPNIQYINGVNVLDNHCVNLLSNLMTAIVTPYFAIYLWQCF